MEILKKINSLFFKVKNRFNFGLKSKKFLFKKDRLNLNPAFYWKLLVFFGIFGIIFIFVLNLYFFWFLNRMENIIDKNKFEEKTAVNRQDLDFIIKEFEHKKIELKRLLNEN